MRTHGLRAPRTPRACGSTARPPGTIDNWELRQVLEAMGQKPTEEELFQMISEVDDNMSGSIGARAAVTAVRRAPLLMPRACLCCADFKEFLKVIEKQKARAAQFDDESDTLDGARRVRHAPAPLLT